MVTRGGASSSSSRPFENAEAIRTSSEQQTHASSPLAASSKTSRDTATEKGSVGDEESVITMDYSNSQSHNNNQNNNGDQNPTHTAHAIALNSASTNATLMQVYASLTQSSTPQVPSPSNNASAVPSGQQQQLHGAVLAPGSSKYHIPPPMFHIPPSVRGSAGDGRTAASAHHSSSNANHQQQQQPNLATSSSSSHMQYHFKEEAGTAIPPAVSIPSSIRMDEGQQQQHAAAAEESDEQSSSHRPSSRRKRRGSQDSSARGGGGGSSGGSVTKPKKKSKQDGRWSKRFTWPEDLHRDFVSAIFDVGLKQSSPSTLLEHMPKHEQITTERIKSHLQKYRLHRAKSKKEFVSSYEASLRKLQNQGGVAGSGTISTAAGEVAAHLTYSNSEDIAGNDGNSGARNADTVPSASASGLSNDNKVGAVPEDDLPGNDCGDPTTNQQSPVAQPTESLMLPELTELEKQSPIGAAMGYLTGLFFSLRQQLLIQRSIERSQEGAVGNVPIEDVYGSFAGAPAAAAVTIASDYPNDGMQHQQSIPSMRTNIEENSIMKREMQNQMVLQNKMRALKEQELAKYKNFDPNPTFDASLKSGTMYQYEGGGDADPYHTKNQSGFVQASDHDDVHGQGTGELVGHDTVENTHRPHGLSFGNNADLWNTDVVDEQLFEFLMND